jgi:hypothetical protein
MTAITIYPEIDQDEIVDICDLGRERGNSDEAINAMVEAYLRSPARLHRVAAYRQQEWPRPRLVVDNG